MKKLAISLICFLPLAVLFCIFTLRFKPDGGVYWTFLVRAPVIVAGDGSGYQTAYQLRHGQADGLASAEIAAIRDRYWAPPGRSREDFYQQCSNTLGFAGTNLNGHAYDIITFTLPTGTNTVYFDVTEYRRKTGH
jgi:hypothetical protein